MNEVKSTKKKYSMGLWISVGLLSGVVCGLLFGEYCSPLQTVGLAYVGLLQMTVLPYLILSLIGKLGRLNLHQARELGLAAVVVLLCLWGIGIFLIALVAEFLPPIQGATFYSSAAEDLGRGAKDFLENYIPANIFRSLNNEAVPAIVVFCLFLGSALISVPGKETLLNFLDLLSAGIGRMNGFLIRLAPLGLFTLTAAAAGTMRIDELSRLQAYLIMFTLISIVAAFIVLPLLLTSFTKIKYLDLIKAAQEPVFTAIATGKLFVVLPQIVEKCEELLKAYDVEEDGVGHSTPSMVVPLAYPFAHLGKIFAFVFISFAAWYSGRALSMGENLRMAATGTLSSFASPLVTIPYLLDEFQLSQDLMAFFILPGFITTRIADVVGVLHLMVLSLVVTKKLQGRISIRWKRLVIAGVATVGCIVGLGGATRWYLASTTVNYDLDEKFLSLSIPKPHSNVTVLRADDVKNVQSTAAGQTAFEKIKSRKQIRVGYHPDHLPYSYFNSDQGLVGLDVELMHRLASRLEFELIFIPATYQTVLDQLATGEIDVAIGGLLVTPERLLLAGFTVPYLDATVSIVMHDHRREEFAAWENIMLASNLRLAVVSADLARAARRQLPDIEIVTINSPRDYFESNESQVDGLIVSAEEGAAWSVIYPEYTVVVPQPRIRKPVAMATHTGEEEWLRFLDQWLEFEKQDGAISRLKSYWVEGQGTEVKAPRWCILRDVLGWLP